MNDSEQIQETEVEGNDDFEDDDDEWGHALSAACCL